MFKKKIIIFIVFLILPINIFANNFNSGLYDKELEYIKGKMDDNQLKTIPKIEEKTKKIFDKIFEKQKDKTDNEKILFLDKIMFSLSNNIEIKLSKLRDKLKDKEKYNEIKYMIGYLKKLSNLERQNIVDKKELQKSIKEKQKQEKSQDNKNNIKTELLNNELMVHVDYSKKDDVSFTEFTKKAKKFIDNGKMTEYGYTFIDKNSGINKVLIFDKYYKLNKNEYFKYLFLEKFENLTLLKVDNENYILVENYIEEHNPTFEEFKLLVGKIILNSEVINEKIHIKENGKYSVFSYSSYFPDVEKNYKSLLNQLGKDKLKECVIFKKEKLLNLVCDNYEILEETALNDTITETRNKVLVLVNKYRAEEGLKPLKLDDQLNKSAQDYAKLMYDNNYYGHVGPNGSQFYDRISKTGYLYQSSAENIARGQITAKDIVEGWMNSPPHRSNIMYPDFKDIGIGFYKYYWVQNFGTKRE